MLEILFSPKIFNYIIMAMYFINAMWWLKNKSIADCCYWLSALAITATVTFGYQRP